LTLDIFPNSTKIYVFLINQMTNLKDLMFQKHYKLSWFIFKNCIMVLAPLVTIGILLDNKFSLAPWGKIISIALAFPVLQIILIRNLKKYLKKVSNDQ